MEWEREKGVIWGGQLTRLYTTSLSSNSCSGHPPTDTNHLHKAKVTSPYETPKPTSHSLWPQEMIKRNKPSPHSRKTTIIIKISSPVRSSPTPTRLHEPFPTHIDPPPATRPS